MKTPLYCCFSYRLVHYYACRPSIQGITFLSCRGYFQLCQRKAAEHSYSILNTGKLRNSLSQTNRSLSFKEKRSEAVVLYSHTNPKFLLMVNIFGYSFGAFWLITSYQFSTMRITPPSEKRTSNLPWFARFDLLSSTTSKVLAALFSSFIGMPQNNVPLLSCYFLNV